MGDSVSHKSQSKQEGNTTTLTELSQKESCELQKGEKISEKEQQSKSFDSADGDRECRSSQEGTLLSAMPQSINIYRGQLSSECELEANALTTVVSSVSDNLHQRRSSSTGSHGVQSSKGESRLSSTLDKMPDQQPGQSRGCVLLLQCDQQVKAPSRYPDKALDDGYNWRKYGQKLVKGNEFVRSYYRCTHPDCRAKRQIERSQGQITDTVYLGRHEHVKPQPGSQVSVSCISPIQALKPEECSLATVEDKSTNAYVSTPTSPEAQSVGSPQLGSTVPADNVLDSSTPQPNLTTGVIDHDGDPNSKRRKTDGEPRYVGEPRVVVQTMSEVDIWNDGYRWRKYGQKLVKGNPNPRSYYRCSSSRCPVKKHVERASYDPKVVITTYEGLHDHDMPPARTVMSNRANANTAAVGDESRSRLEENIAAGLDMVVHISAKSEACS